MPFSIWGGEGGENAEGNALARGAADYTYGDIIEEPGGLLEEHA